jgi:hypothetical protein
VARESFTATHQHVVPSSNRDIDILTSACLIIRLLDFIWLMPGFFVLESEAFSISLRGSLPRRFSGWHLISPSCYVLDALTTVISSSGTSRSRSTATKKCLIFFIFSFQSYNSTIKPPMLAFNHPPAAQTLINHSSNRLDTCGEN